MSWGEFAILFSTTLAAMLACRVLPAFVLKGKQISEKFQTCLNLIPPAAFASLVANDIFTPGMFDSGVWPAAIPLMSCLFVIYIAQKTKSIIICFLAGIGVYALLLLSTTSTFSF